jgi:exopolysaccharide biosynthesis operon protein EpsL
MTIFKKVVVSEISGGYSICHKAVTPAVVAGFLLWSVLACADGMLPLPDPLDKLENPDTLNFNLGAQVRYDSNLFRLSGSESPDPALGHSRRSDMIYSTNAGIRIDKPYAQQRFQFQATVVDNRFQTYDFLNFTAFNYRAAWDWHLTPRVSGILLAEQKQEMNSFAEYRQTQKNVQTSNVRLFNVDGDIGGGFHLIGGLLDVRARNSRTFVQVGDYQQDGYEFGGKYVSRAGNWISVLRRNVNGEYQGRELDVASQLDTGFDQSETEANLFWRFTGKSSVEGKLGYVDRNHDHFSSRDYSGATGRLLYRWEPTGKTQINVGVSRYLYSYQEAANSYYVADTFTLQPIWQYSPKTTFRARYDYSHRDYRGAIVDVPEMRRDHLQIFQLAADWKAARNIILTGTLERDLRDSNIDTYTFKDTSASINAQFLF